MRNGSKLSIKHRPLLGLGIPFCCWSTSPRYCWLNSPLNILFLLVESWWLVVLPQTVLIIFQFVLLSDDHAGSYPINSRCVGLDPVQIVQQPPRINRTVGYPWNFDKRETWHKFHPIEGKIWRKKHIYFDFIGGKQQQVSCKQNPLDQTQWFLKIPNLLP